MDNHLAAKLVPLEKIRPDVSIAVCRWVMHLLQLNPDDRPVDARAAMDLLNIARATKDEEITETISTAKTVVPVVTTANPVMAPRALEHTEQIISTRPEQRRVASQPISAAQPATRGRYKPKEKKNSEINKGLVAILAISIITLFVVIAMIFNDTQRRPVSPKLTQEK